MTPQHHREREGGGDEVSRTPDPLQHENYRFMIRSTYEGMKELKESLDSLVASRNADNVRIDRLEQAHKNNNFWIKTLAATAVTAIGGAIWSLITSGQVKPPTSHP